MQHLMKELTEQGYILLQGAINAEQVSWLKKSTQLLQQDKSPYGVRNILKKLPDLRDFLASASIRRIINTYIGETAFPVRAIYFDKTPEANWNVAWHQDTTIAVQEQIEVTGYGPWSEKEGVVHVEPPLHILENLTTLRIHLDRTDESNGVLRVIPGSHQHGRLKSSELLKLLEQSEPVVCVANPGDLLIMKPLILHSSNKSQKPNHRRIIHIEYASINLAPPLKWDMALNNCSGSHTSASLPLS
jgi:hypothetical protein